jgi:hypothetical protein
MQDYGGSASASRKRTSPVDRDLDGLSVQMEKVLVKNLEAYLASPPLTGNPYRGVTSQYFRRRSSFNTPQRRRPHVERLCAPLLHGIHIPGGSELKYCSRVVLLSPLPPCRVRYTGIAIPYDPSASKFPPLVQGPL